MLVKEISGDYCYFC